LDLRRRRYYYTLLYQEKWYVFLFIYLGRGGGLGMKKEKVEYFKGLLNQKIEEILSGAEKTLSDMTELTDKFPDPADRATLESDRNFELRIRDRERKLLQKIQSALERIDDGTFGVCESCGEDISEKRLEARPVTTLCLDCKKKQENTEKTRGT
jgi:DnaK suppressor protein